MSTKSQYRVFGRIGYTDDYYDQPATWVGKRLDEAIDATNDEEAVAKGREVIASFIEKNKKLHPDNHTNHSDHYPELQFTITRVHILCEIKWKEGRVGKPAEPEIKEIKPHIEENVTI